jgi:MoaA/NifB/PqqE/SkfB family radical SAM enzyme
MRFNNIWCYRHILASKGFIRSLWHSRRNLAAHGRGGPPGSGPYMAELDLTYRCNCRCRMCQRWQDTRKGELAAAEYARLAAEFADLGVHQISIAGGEPLLREDVFDIIEHHAGLGLSVNLCTNGMLVEDRQRDILESGATCVTVSLDGATAESHDWVRGTPGSFGRIKRGIAALLARRRGRRPVVRVRMTVSGFNAGEVRRFYGQWHGVADDVLFQPAHHCGHSYYTGLEEPALHPDPGLLAAQLDGTLLAQDAYMRRWVEGLREQRFPPRAPCYAGYLMARIDPWGNVYPCLEQHVCVGSVRTERFAKVWNSLDFNRERARLAGDRTCACWYNNTALIGHFGSRLSRTLFPAAAQKAAAPAGARLKPTAPGGSP